MKANTTPTLNLKFLSNLKWWQATIMISIILLSAAVAVHEGANVSVTLSLDARVSAIENALNIPVNSSLSAFRKSNSYIISLVDTYACFQNGSTAGLREYNTNHSAIIMDALGNASVSGGSVYVAEGSYSASIILQDNTRVVIDKGATGITVASVASGANCILEDFNNNVFKYWSNGSIESIFDYANGNLLTASANLTTLYVKALVPFTNGYVSIFSLVVENGTSYPDSPMVGQLFYRSDLFTLYYWNSTNWVSAGSSGGGVADDDTLYLLSVSATNFLFQNGTRVLTADWNAGSYGIYGCTWLNSTSINSNNYYLNSQILGFLEPATFILNVTGSTYNAWYGANGTLAFSSTDARSVISNALGNLSSGRTYQQKIVLMGMFNLTSTTASEVIVPSYTFLDMTQAQLNLAAVTSHYMITNENYAGDSCITLLGGKLNGTQAIQSAGFGVLFENVSQSKIERLAFQDIWGYGLTLNDCHDIIVDSCFFNDGGGDDDASIHNCTCVSITNCNSINHAKRVVTGASSFIEIEAGCNHVSITNCLGNESDLVTDSCFNIHSHAGEIPNQNIVLTGCQACKFGNYSFRIHDENSGVQGHDISLIGCDAEGGQLAGFYSYNQIGVSFINCIANASGRYGFYILNNNYTQLIGCKATFNGRDGLEFGNCQNCKVSGGYYMDNSQSVTYSCGILIFDSSTLPYSLHTTITGATCSDDQTSSTQRYGIQTKDSSDYTMILTCTFFGNVISNITLVGSHNVVKRNDGYITEADGTQASCINGTWIALPAGFAGTPTDIILTLKANAMINSTFEYMQPTVIAVNSTHFQIGFLLQTLPNNTLSGITPTSASWGTAPANLANASDGSESTWAGTGETNKSSSGLVGTVTWNMGANYSVLLEAKLGLCENDTSKYLSVYWQYSYDGTNFYYVTGAGAISSNTASETMYWPTPNYVTTQYVRLYFSTNGQSRNDVNIYEVYAWQAQSMLTVGSANAQSISWSAIYTP
jgi:hypothetical protein